MSSLSPKLRTGASLVRSVRKMWPPRMIDCYALYAFKCSPRRTNIRARISPGVAIPWPAAPPIAIERSTFAIPNPPFGSLSSILLCRSKSAGRDLFKNLIHLRRRESPQGLYTNVAKRAHARGEGHDRTVVLGLRGKDRVKSSHRPVNVFDFDAEIRSSLDQGLRSFRGLADLTDALISKIYER